MSIIYMSETFPTKLNTAGQTVVDLNVIAL